MDHHTIQRRSPNTMTKCRAAQSSCSSAPGRWSPIEFLQQEWINGNFIGAGSEREAIVRLQQEGATFPIPKGPVRRRVDSIETVNVLRGGEYSSCRACRVEWLGDAEN